MYRSAAKGHTEVCELLLTAKADVRKPGFRGMTALHWAAYNGCHEVCKLLIAFKADLAARDVRIPSFFLFSKSLIVFF
jgi:ankyrin repeat protein